MLSSSSGPAPVKGTGWQYPDFAKITPSVVWNTATHTAASSYTAFVATHFVANLRFDRPLPNLFANVAPRFVEVASVITALGFGSYSAYRSLCREAAPTPAPSGKSASTQAGGDPASSSTFVAPGSTNTLKRLPDASISPPNNNNNVPQGGAGAHSPPLPPQAADPALAVASAGGTDSGAGLTSANSSSSPSGAPADSSGAQVNANATLSNFDFPTPAGDGGPAAGMRSQIITDRRGSAADPVIIIDHSRVGAGDAPPPSAAAPSAAPAAATGTASDLANIGPFIRASGSAPSSQPPAAPATTPPATTTADVQASLFPATPAVDKMQVRWLQFKNDILTAVSWAAVAYVGPTLLNLLQTEGPQKMLVSRVFKGIVSTHPVVQSAVNTIASLGPVSGSALAFSAVAVTRLIAPFTFVEARNKEETAYQNKYDFARVLWEAPLMISMTHVVLKSLNIPMTEPLHRAIWCTAIGASAADHFDLLGSFPRF